MVSASRGVANETRSKKESRSRNVFFIILLPLGAFRLTRFSKTRMLLQAGERGRVARASDASSGGKGCGSVFYCDCVDDVRFERSHRILLDKIEVLDPHLFTLVRGELVHCASKTGTEDHGPPIVR